MPSRNCFPGVPQVACFDTAFHRGQPAVAELVRCRAEIRARRCAALWLSWAVLRIHRFGAASRCAPEIAGGRVIVAHLGSGASLCALKDRKSIDSTFGFTALDGLCMGTRPGAVDPGSFSIYSRRWGFRQKKWRRCSTRSPACWASPASATTCANCWPVTIPMRAWPWTISCIAPSKEIGALAAAAGGIDALVFTAGIGEKSAEIRRRICESTSWLGIALDEAANARHELRITHPHSAVSAWVIPTNEELMIARHTWDLLGIQARH